MGLEQITKDPFGFLKENWAVVLSVILAILVVILFIVAVSKGNELSEVAENTKCSAVGNIDKVDATQEVKS